MRLRIAIACLCVFVAGCASITKEVENAAKELTIVLIVKRGEDTLRTYHCKYDPERKMPVNCVEVK